MDPNRSRSIDPDIHVATPSTIDEPPDAAPAFPRQHELAAGGVPDHHHKYSHLPRPFDRLILPEAGDDVPEAVRLSISLLECGPLAATAPLLGAIYLAPLASLVAPDFLLWLWGANVTRAKSELAGLAAAHFGNFDAKTLPSWWALPDLERSLSFVKDVLIVVDDFVYESQIGASQRLGGILDDVSARRGPFGLAHAGDVAGYALIVGAGDKVPPRGEALLPIFAAEDLLDRPRLRALDAHRHRLPHAIRGYLGWLEPRLPVLRAEVARTEFRHMSAFGGDVPASLARHAAQISIGLELMLTFADDLRVAGLPRLTDLQAAVSLAIEKATIFRRLRELPSARRVG